MEDALCEKEENMNIKKQGCTFNHQELGLKEVIYHGKRYIDVTPFWIDSKERTRIENYMEDKIYKGGRE